jgi:hypothetical protein
MQKEYEYDFFSQVKKADNIGAMKYLGMRLVCDLGLATTLFFAITSNPYIALIAPILLITGMNCHRIAEQKLIAV